MQHLEVSCAVRRLFKSLGFKGLSPVRHEASSLSVKNIYIIYNNCALLSGLYLTLSNHLHRSTTSGLIALLAAIMHVTYI